jgi:hypothetical protein
VNGPFFALLAIVIVAVYAPGDNPLGFPVATTHAPTPATRHGPFSDVVNHAAPADAVVETVAPVIDTALCPAFPNWIHLLTGAAVAPTLNWIEGCTSTPIGIAVTFTVTGTVFTSPWNVELGTVICPENDVSGVVEAGAVAVT